ncbi:hypothetical protein [Salinibacter ruber]|uniref:hypothetical protein n=1 Tax=Salinibacter ruber TaxID=146919 RepID=UPI002168DC6C|nr:hypothetical protein [Salinibacter ruber]MCS3696237.1 hypothetical protein [Salinibacter ruber]
MDAFRTSTLSILCLLPLALGVLAGCDSSDSGMNADQPLRQVSYDLSAQSNDGALSDGVSATATFQELPDNQTLVTLELDNTTNAGVTHPAHIHRSSDGEIAFRLSPIDGTNQKGITSARVVNRSFEQLADFDGYINIHESAANLGNVVAQGDIGANADGQTSEGLNVINSPDSKTYSLSANSNDGSVASSGIPGTVQITELTGSLTLVQVSLDPGTENGATGASVSHPAHIHRSSDGGIEYYLSPVSGLDPDARSGKLVEESYSTLVDFNGYVNVHQSAAKLKNVVAQGDIGANASGGDGGNGGGGGGGGGGY